tara:strand:+ start:2557 stop:2802 length:246 start_codon:yes stop_codon:yes gene_type:complete
MVTYISIAILVAFITILIWKDVTCTRTKTRSYLPVQSNMPYQQAIERKKEIDKLVGELQEGGWDYTKYNMISSIRRRDDDV